MNIYEVDPKTGQVAESTTESHLNYLLGRGFSKEAIVEALARTSAQAAKTRQDIIKLIKTRAASPVV